MPKDLIDAIGYMKMKLCSHVIKHDCGLAPNPFHGYCTTALCTPSHMRARLEEGDWLIGVSPRRDGNRLVYAMRISECLSMNEYFHDERFESKKPNRMELRSNNAATTSITSGGPDGRACLRTSITVPTILIKMPDAPSSSPNISTILEATGWLSQMI